MIAPEFSRPQPLDTIGSAERAVTVTATPDECRLLAARFGLRAVDRLEGVFTLRAEAAGVRVSGRVRAGVVQACSIAGDPLPATIDEPLDLLFVADTGGDGDDIELGEDAIDTLFHDGQAIDLGEAAAETMALALDPFPRGPNADVALRTAGVLDEGTAGPFGALAGLLKPKG